MRRRLAVATALLVGIGLPWGLAGCSTELAGPPPSAALVTPDVSPSQAPSGTPSQRKVDIAIDHFVTGRNALASTRGADRDDTIRAQETFVSEWRLLARTVRQGIKGVPRKLTREVAVTARAAARTVDALAECFRAYSDPKDIISNCLEVAADLQAQRYEADQAMKQLIAFGSRPADEVVAGIVPSLDRPPTGTSQA